MYKGRIMDIVDAKTASKESLGLLMAGVHPTETTTTENLTPERVF
jgi:hypothetical protein